MPKRVGWSNLPDELKQRRQWCVSNYTDPDPLTCKAPRVPKRGAPRASILNPNDWSTFEEAATFAWEHGTDDWAIGFVLTAEDGLCCIDMDVKGPHNKPDDPSSWTTQEQLEEYWRKAQYLDSYTETSISGKALHVWVKAQIGKGVRHAGVEIYSQERYIICTGDVILERPIRNKQAEMTAAVEAARQAQLESDKLVLKDLVEIDQTLTDMEVLERAGSAANAEKYLRLAKGDWKEMGYPSQSEADLALMSILAFYSMSNEQCRRLFRTFKLGKRAKATKDDRYLNETLKLIRTRQAEQQEIELAGILKAADLMLNLHKKLPPRASKLLPQTPADRATSSAPAHTSTAPCTPAQVLANTAQSAPQGPLVLPTQIEGELSFPPGIVGEVAKFIYHSSPRPVLEVAVVGALGFFAGVCGKAYCLPQTGLNVYIILVAQSAVGKEAMHSGIALVLDALKNRTPEASKFVDFSEFASGPALIKACIGNPSFVNVTGEWGRKLRRLANDGGNDGAMASLRTAMTNLYQKSGPQSVVGGLSYSNKENNIVSASGVAYSMIGETTPKTYYESLTESMMEDGFLSRFTMVEYSGHRVPLNENPVRELPADLGDNLLMLVSEATALCNSALGSRMVEKSSEAEELFRQFERECDIQINSSNEESWRQMWNRASLKALRIAGLLAVADNNIYPVIEKHHCLWALDLIRRDIDLMMKRLGSGDIGVSDDSRQKKLLSVMKQYLTGEIPDSYNIPPELKANAIVPRKFLQLRISRVAAFCNHRLGAVSALDHALRSLVDNGHIQEVSSSDLVAKYNFHGKCYRILDLPW